MYSFINFILQKINSLSQCLSNPPPKLFKTFKIELVRGGACEHTRARNLTRAKNRFNPKFQIRFGQVTSTQRFEDSDNNGYSITETSFPQRSKRWRYSTVQTPDLLFGLVESFVATKSPSKTPESPQSTSGSNRFLGIG